MPKNKIKRYTENATFPNVVLSGHQAMDSYHPLRGNWAATHFQNNRGKGLILELGCGKGEYTLGLARMNPHKNHVGVDLKGARIWKGAKTALEEQLENVAFLRAPIEQLDRFFAPSEVEEIWIPFPDPQLKERRAKKRLTGPFFLQCYAGILKDQGRIHLKTDSETLFLYTQEVLISLDIAPDLLLNDVDTSHPPCAPEIREIKTHYEQKFRKEGKGIRYLCFRIPSGIPFDA